MSARHKKNNEKYLSLKNVYADKAKRSCLMCGKKFISRGSHNRRCPKCYLKINQAAENTFYITRVYNSDVDIITCDFYTRSIK